MSTVIAQWPDRPQSAATRSGFIDALWAWQAEDRNAFRWLAEQLATIKDYFSGCDPGPLGFTLAYLHLAQRTLKDTASNLPAWESAEAALEGSGYWLELAIFSALLGQSEKTARFLGQFQRLRREALVKLESLPSWLAVEWQDAVNSRELQEQSLLYSTSPPEVADLRQMGILPL